MKGKKKIIIEICIHILVYNKEIKSRRKNHSYTQSHLNLNKSSSSPSPYLQK